MALTCRNIRQLHDAFVDGELSSSLTAEVHAHLLQCPACQQQVEMLRAVGDVIARDPVSGPQLDSGFAQRVVSSIPIAVSAGADRRRRLIWRVVAKSSVPAAAAAMFLAIGFWPHAKPDKPARVLGTIALKPMVDPTVSAVVDTQKAAQNFEQLVKIGLDQARSDVKQSLQKADRPGPSAKPLSLTDVLLIPFDEILNPPTPPAQKPDDTKSVRF